MLLSDEKLYFSAHLYCRLRVAKNVLNFCSAFLAFPYQSVSSLKKNKINQNKIKQNKIK